MPVETQIKLLRVLQEREFERVGGTETIFTDIRLVSASNENLEEAMQEGRFRQDLFYRIDVIHIDLPPLRERKDDLPLLINHFVKQFPSRDGSVKQISPEVMSAVRRYDWPGNVRELRNLVERVCITSPGQRIELGDLPPNVRSGGSRQGEGGDAREGPWAVPDESLAGYALEEVERRAIEATLRAENGNKTHSAKILGIGLKTLYRKIERYRIDI
jgi:DNA-binding NtrC family response regulator